MGDSLDHFTSFPNMADLAVIITYISMEYRVDIRELSDPSAESDVDFDVVTGDFPGVSVGQPVIRKLGLITVDNLLFEDTVGVTNTVAHGWNRQRSKGIKKTRR